MTSGYYRGFFSTKATVSGSCFCAFLCVDQVVEDDLLGAVFDAVHSADPGHLIAGFEGFGDALALGHLCGEALHHLFGLAVDLLQVAVEAALQ